MVLCQDLATEGIPYNGLRKRQHNMFMDHVDISQAFCQGDLLPGDGHNGKVYISAPPGYPEDPDCTRKRRSSDVAHT